MSFCLMFLVFLYIAASTSGGVYQFHGNPYTEGPLPVDAITLTEIFDSAPSHMIVHFPTLSDSYVPIIFVPGVNGLIYAEWYSDVLKQIASHGYITIGLDLYYPAIGQQQDEMHNDRGLNVIDKKLFKVINWLIANLNQNVITLHGLPNLTVNWDLLGLSGHSAGCDKIRNIIQNNSTLAKAVALIEPFDFFFTHPINYSLPSLSYGTEYANYFPKCAFPPYDYQHFYKMLPCPKILMNVTGFGHCDILNEADWTTCHDLHLCKTVKNNDRIFYRTFIAGYISGFFGYYLQSNNEMLTYITDKDQIPVVLGDFKYETKC